MEASIDPQLSIQRIASIHIHMVAPNPAEGRAVKNLQPIQINRAAAQEIQVLLGKIRADHRDQVDLAIERRGGRKKRSGPAEDLLDTGKRSFNRIKGY